VKEEYEQEDLDVDDRTVLKRDHRKVWYEASRKTWRKNTNRKI